MTRHQIKKQVPNSKIKGRTKGTNSSNHISPRKIDLPNALAQATKQANLSKQFLIKITPKVRGPNNNKRRNRGPQRIPPPAKSPFSRTENRSTRGSSGTQIQESTNSNLEPQGNGRLAVIPRRGGNPRIGEGF